MSMSVSSQTVQAFELAVRDGRLFPFEVLAADPAECSEKEAHKRAVDIAQKIKRSITEVHELIAWYVAQTDFALPELTCDEVESHPVSSGDPVIDDLLGGGFYSRCITEVYGESRAGKTTFVLQLAQAVQSMPENVGKYAVIVATEGGTQLERQGDMIPRFPDADLSSIQLLRSNHPLNLEELLESDLERRLGEKQLSVLIIDSVAILREATRGDKANHVPLQRIAHHLRRLANKYNIPVVVVNQLRDQLAVRMLFDEADDVRYQANQERWLGGYKTQRLYWLKNRKDEEAIAKASASKGPVLGYEWTSSIDTRLVLYLEEDARSLELVFSPFAPPGKTGIDLNAEGIRGHAQ